MKKHIPNRMFYEDMTIEELKEELEHCKAMWNEFEHGSFKDFDDREYNLEVAWSMYGSNIEQIEDYLEEIGA